jgi:dCMP deaminase
MVLLYIRFYMTPKKLQTYMLTASQFAQNSPDKHTKVGSILVHKKTHSVLQMAYNGFIRGAMDQALPLDKPLKYSYLVHSEVNLICGAARHGVNTSDCLVICTLSPCINCLRVLWQSGIDTVYYRDTYKDFAENLQMKDLIIDLEQIGEYTKLTMRGSKDE